MHRAASWLAGEQIGADVALVRGLVDQIGTRGDALVLAAEIAEFVTLTLAWCSLQSLAGSGSCDQLRDH
ncbi:MAG: hypothetical protein ACRDRK_00835 [Pseudonocardia sp.]